MAETLRQELIDFIRRLPADKLPQVESLLSHLECGNSLPLSFLATPVEHSTTESQRLAARITSDLQDRRKESGDESPHSKGGPQSKDWPHAPVHRISEHGTYIVTAGTLAKEHLFCGPDRLNLLESKLLTLAGQFRWNLEAWAVFSNHYHFVANSDAESENLRTFITQLHAETAVEVNQIDQQSGRQVWFNFWDTRLTYEKSYLARLNNVHQNPVRHGLVAVANQYRWCSAAWFERTASRAQVSTIYSFKTNQIKIVDDYDPM